jgi:eukaryotic-like serine/threonine-protein kinase
VKVARSTKGKQHGFLARTSSVTDTTPPKAQIAVTTLGRVGGFELLVELAAGGMATVFLAHAVDGRVDMPMVAVKRPHRHLATDKVFLSMLIDEARLASTISHANVVRVRELGFEGGEPFVVMDYVEGASLSELRKALSTMERAIEPRVAVRIILDALYGLHAAHEQKDESGKHLGIIHRDVSPHNIIVGADGVSRLTDFGIAKAEDRVQTTRTHEVKGKLAYLAPERVDKRRMCTAQSDIFSMAVVLWECIAGRRLFRGDEAIDTLQEVMSAPIPRLKQVGARVPAALDDVIARALSRDLETRHLTAADLAAAIERASGKDGVGSAADVARVVEAVFGEKMAIRQEHLRRAAPHVDLDALLERSSVPQRPKPKSDDVVIRESIIASLAPRAPSTRYNFGAVSEATGPAARTRVRGGKRAGVISAILGGVLLGTVFAVAFVWRTRGDTTALPVADLLSADASTSPGPSIRRVIVPLPFVAVKVSFDDANRELEPPADIASFDVARESGVRHRVVALASDGSRAEGFVMESSGLATAEPEGFTITRTPPAQPRGAGARVMPIGTKKNGFTKLK